MVDKLIYVPNAFTYQYLLDYDRKIKVRIVCYSYSTNGNLNNVMRHIL